MPLASVLRDKDPSKAVYRNQFDNWTYTFLGPDIMHLLVLSPCSPQPATAYQAAQTAYVQPAHQTAYATATAPRAAQAYETYPATHTTGQYAYAATRPQVPVSKILTLCAVVS